MSAAQTYSVDEAAAAIGMSPQRLRAAIRRGDVAAEQRGSRYLLSRATVEHLTAGAPSGAGYHTRTTIMDTTDWAPGRRDLTEHELAEFAEWWNESAVELGRDDLEGRGFAVVIGPHVVHVDFPLSESRRVVLTVKSTDEQWSPVPAVNARAAANVFDLLADRFQEIEDLARSSAPLKEIAFRAWTARNHAAGASFGAGEAMELQPIPEGCALEGVGLVYVPEGVAA